MPAVETWLQDCYFINKERPWGSDCQVCKDKCCGHYKDVLINVCDSHALDTITLPLSTILKKEFNTITFSLSDDLCKRQQKSNVITMWYEYLAGTSIHCCDEQKA